MSYTSTSKIVSIQYLRGAAALFVVICHFGSKLENYPALSAIFTLGRIGVYLFFLISGFIIVYSLIKSSYQPSQFFIFLLKRYIRIDPSYFVVIILYLLLMHILHQLPGFRGRPAPFIPMQFFAHLFYFIPFTKYKLYMNVFWTLSVEFQFYLLIGLLFFLSDKPAYRFVFVLIFSLSSLITWPFANYVIFNYAPVFGLGISLVPLFQNKTWKNLILPFFNLLLVIYKFELGVSLLLVVSSLIILYYKGIIRSLDFFANISYSLYLTHPLVRIIAVGFLKKFNVDLKHYAIQIMLMEIVVAIFTAWIFYLLIERPSLILSKQLFYRSNKRGTATATTF